MSIRTLLIWIIIAGVLGAGVVLIRAQQQVQNQALPNTVSRTLGFDPANTIGLERLTGTQRQFLERDTNQLDRWVLHWAQGGNDQTWIVDPLKARSGLRALATARVNSSEENLVTSVRGEVVIRQRSGDSIRVEFDSVSSGGYTPIRVEERASDGIATGRWYGRIEKSIADTFLGVGMMEWRSDRVFDLSNSAIQTVELEAGGSSVLLAKSDAGWAIDQPIRIHGDTEMIEDLIKALLAIRAGSFIDSDLDAQTTGINTPIATVRLSTASEHTTLVIGTRSDVNGDAVYGVLETQTGQALITLETNQLAKITAFAQAYIGKSPSSMNAVDVRTVRIKGEDGITRFDATRTMEHWMIGDAQADSINSDAINRLIAMLSRDRTEIIRVVESADALSPIGFIELLGSTNQVLDRFGVALDSTSAGMRVLVMQEVDADDGSTKAVIWAMDSDEAMASGAWLTAVASKRVP